MATPDPGGKDDDAAMRARLANLSGAIDMRRQASRTPGSSGGGLPSPNGLSQAMSLGFRVMTEFVAAVVVGGFIGWAIDRAIGTSPAFLIAFLALGTAAGFWNVYRIAMGTGGSKGGPRR